MIILQDFNNKKINTNKQHLFKKVTGLSKCKNTMSQKGLITQVDVINITFKKEIELMCTKCTQLIWRLKKKN